MEPQTVSISQATENKSFFITLRNFISDQFSWKILSMQLFLLCTIFIILIILGKEYDFENYYNITDKIFFYVHILIINFPWILCLIIIVKTIYLYYLKKDIKKTFNILFVGGLVQLLGSGYLVNIIMRIINILFKSHIQIPYYIKYGDLYSHILGSTGFILTLTIGILGIYNMIGGLFNIKRVVYRTNYFILPIIISLLTILIF